MTNRKKVMAASNNAILGTFEGEVLDSNITNKNGLDITKEVMTTVLDSEDYQEGIKYGWFIGFLGHPEDPNCMDFKDACIVMTEMTVDDNGKVYGKFNLIDTPVGRTVKAFIDAGVTFGISIRGAGDIIGSSVDPDTFVFRGFDLVSFPAYPESIPEYTAVAAATNLSDRKKYQAVCAAVRANLKDITSSSTLEVLKSQFAPQSAEYKMLEKQAKNINSSATFNIDKQKVDAMTNLYLQSQEALAECNKHLSESRQRNRAIKSSYEEKLQSMRSCNAKDLQSVKASYERKINSMKRVMDNQLSDLSNELDSVTASRDSLKHKISILASEKAELNSNITSLNSQIKGLQKSNLIYKQRVEANTQASDKQDDIIAGLKKQLSETVTAKTKIQTAASNRDDENRTLRKKLEACENLLTDFQQAYANIYANMLGVRIDSLSITSSTKVDEIERIITEATNTTNITSIPTQPIDTFYEEFEDDAYGGNLVTL